MSKAPSLNLCDISVMLLLPCYQGRTKWRNCRLTPQTPDYQLGWTVLDASRLLDTVKWNFLIYGVKILLTYYLLGILSLCSLVSHKLWLIWIGIKQKKKIFLFERKIKNGRLKKTEFFNHHQKLSNFRQNFTDWSLG